MNQKYFVIICLLITLFTVISCQSSYKHRYGKGHGGGHGFYGYPVGRKWGYTSYIKHPVPKHNHHKHRKYVSHSIKNGGLGYNKVGHGGGNSGQFGGQMFAPVWPAFGQYNSFGGGGHMPFSRGYPGLASAPDYSIGGVGGGYGGNNGAASGGHRMLASAEQRHPNHNYGDQPLRSRGQGGRGVGGAGVQHHGGQAYGGQPYDPELGSLMGLDFLTNEFPNSFLQLTMPTELSNFIPYQ